MRKLRYGYQLTLVVTIAAMLPACPRFNPDITGKIRVGDSIRSYELHLPDGYDAARTYPLVIALHPFGCSGVLMKKLTGFNAIADRENFLVAYPDGIQRMWNSNPVVTHYIGNTFGEDTEFVLALTDKLIEDYGADPDRIYVTGASAGGLMTHRLASELGERFAAASTVMSTLPADWPEHFQPSEPLPFLIVHGTDDPFLPWDGGGVDEGLSGEVNYFSVDDTAAYWVLNNKSQVEPDSLSLPDVDPNDGTRVKRKFHAGPNGTFADVVVYEVHGGGHTWPGSPDLQPELILGKTSMDVNASELIWEFFKSHRRGGSVR